MQRAKETGISGELKTSNIRVVDQAEVPRSPVSPNKSRIFCWGFWWSHRRVGLRSSWVARHQHQGPDEIKQFLGLSFSTCAGAWWQRTGRRAVAPSGRCGPSKLRRGVSRDPDQRHVLLCCRRPRSVVVTSTQRSRERRLSRQSAMSLAQTASASVDGRRHAEAAATRTLQDDPGSRLVEPPGRKARAMKASGDRASQPLVMPAGPNPPNPAELLGSARFRQLVKGVRDHFDWIVIDSPPVMAVTDASVIGHLATGSSSSSAASR